MLLSRALMFGNFRKLLHFTAATFLISHQTLYPIPYDSALVKLPEFLEKLVLTVAKQTSSSLGLNPRDQDELARDSIQHVAENAERRQASQNQSCLSLHHHLPALSAFQLSTIVDSDYWTSNIEVPNTIITRKCLRVLQNGSET